MSLLEKAVALEDGHHIADSVRLAACVALDISAIGVRTQRKSRLQAAALTMNVALPKFDPVTPAEIWVGVGGDIGELCLSKKPAQI